MQLRTQCRWADWGVDDIVQHLRRWSDHYDLVLEKCPIGVIRLPQFGIENFIEPVRFECVRRGETNHVAVKIARHIIAVANFSQSASGKRFINFFARMRRQAREFPIRHAITHSANFSVDHIRPEIHESDTVIQELRRRNQRTVRCSRLHHAILHIEIGTEDDLVVVTIERGVKCRVTIVGRIKKQIKYNQACPRPKQTIKQKRPNLALPRERPLRQELKSPVALEFFRAVRRQL